MGYLSILETSQKWGISKRRIQILCADGRIPGAMRIGNYWAIPDDAVKPSDARIKSGKYLGARAKARERKERESAIKNDPPESADGD